MAALVLFRINLIKLCEIDNKCHLASLFIRRKDHTRLKKIFPNIFCFSYLSLKQIFTKADIVICFGVRSIVFSSIFRPFSNRVWVFSGVGSAFRGRKTLKVVFVKQAIRFFCMIQNKTIKEIIVLNKSDKKHLLKIITVNSNKIRIIPAEAFSKKDYHETDLIKVGFVGRLTNEKGIDVFYEAIRLLKTNLLDKLCVFLIGNEYKNNPSYTNISDLNKIDIVHISRYKQNYAPAVLNLMDIIILPSKFEGMPFSLLEALLTDKYIVISTAPGHLEHMIELKEFKKVVWFKSESFIDLSEKLSEIIKKIDNKKPDKVNIDEERNLFVNRFDFSRNAHEWKKMWQDH